MKRKLFIILPAFLTFVSLTSCGGGGDKPTPEPETWKEISFDDAKTFISTNYADKTPNSLKSFNMEMDCTQSEGTLERETMDKTLQELYGTSYTKGSLKCSGDFTSGTYFEGVKPSFETILTVNALNAYKETYTEKFICSTYNKKFRLEVKGVNKSIPSTPNAIEGTFVFNENGQYESSNGTSTVTGISTTGKTVTIQNMTFVYGDPIPKGSITETEWKDAFNYLLTENEQRNYSANSIRKSNGVVMATQTYTEAGLKEKAVQAWQSQTSTYFTYKISEGNYKQSDGKSTWVDTNKFDIENLFQSIYLNNLINNYSSFTYSNNKYVGKISVSTYGELNFEIQFDTNKKVSSVYYKFTYSETECVCETTFTDYGTSTIPDFPSQL